MRALISDFAVIIAIISMVVVDYLTGIDTPKMQVMMTKIRQIPKGMMVIDGRYIVTLPPRSPQVPDTITPTWKGRQWLIHPFGNEPEAGVQELEPNPWWSSIAAVIPALLASILIFMDQQITAVIVNRQVV